MQLQLYHCTIFHFEKFFVRPTFPLHGENPLRGGGGVQVLISQKVNETETNGFQK